MSVIWRLYQRLNTNHPLKTQMMTAGVLCGSGDFISQFIIEKKTLRTYEAKRTIRFFGVGCFYIAPMLRGWFHVLDRIVGKPSKIAPLKKVFLDQCIWAPPFLSSILSVLWITDGYTPSECVENLKREFKPIFLTGLKVWPATQLLNFYLVPLEYRVLLVQVVALFWNTYIAFMTSKDHLIEIESATSIPELHLTPELTSVASLPLLDTIPTVAKDKSVTSTVV